MMGTALISAGCALGLAGLSYFWSNWSNALLATASYGQGISATLLQMVTAYTPLANGGQLVRPVIIDSVIRSDGTVVARSRGRSIAR